MGAPAPAGVNGRRGIMAEKKGIMSVFVSRGLPDMNISVTGYRVLLDQGSHGMFARPNDKDLREALLDVYRGMKAEAAGSPGFKVSMVAGDVIRVEKLGPKPGVRRKPPEPGPAGKPPVILVRKSEVPAFLAQLDVFEKSRYSAR